MQGTAAIVDAGHGASWEIAREGTIVGRVELSHEAGGIVVTTGSGASERRHSFGSMQDADAFTSDLLTSFAYLGCDVTRT